MPIQSLAVSRSNSSLHSLSCSHSQPTTAAASVAHLSTGRQRLWCTAALVRQTFSESTAPTNTTINNKQQTSNSSRSEAYNKCTVALHSVTHGWRWWIGVTNTAALLHYQPVHHRRRSLRHSSNGNYSLLFNKSSADSASSSGSFIICRSLTGKNRNVNNGMSPQHRHHVISDNPHRRLANRLPPFVDRRSSCGDCFQSLVNRFVDWFSLTLRWTHCTCFPLFLSTTVRHRPSVVVQLSSSAKQQQKMSTQRLVVFMCLWWAPVTGGPAVYIYFFQYAHLYIYHLGNHW